MLRAIVGPEQAKKFFEVLTLASEAMMVKIGLPDAQSLSNTLSVALPASYTIYTCKERRNKIKNRPNVFAWFQKVNNPPRMKPFGILKEMKMSLEWIGRIKWVVRVEIQRSIENTYP